MEFVSLFFNVSSQEELHTLLSDVNFAVCSCKIWTVRDPLSVKMIPSLRFMTLLPAERSHFKPPAPPPDPLIHTELFSIVNDELVGCMYFGTFSTSTSELKKRELLWHTVSTRVWLNLFVKRFHKWGCGADKTWSNEPWMIRFTIDSQLKHIQHLAITINTSGTLCNKNNFLRTITVGILSFVGFSLTRGGLSDSGFWMWSLFFFFKVCPKPCQFSFVQEKRRSSVLCKRMLPHSSSPLSRKRGRGEKEAMWGNMVRWKMWGAGRGWTGGFTSITVLLSDSTSD